MTIRQTCRLFLLSTLAVGLPLSQGCSSDSPTATSPSCAADGVCQGSCSDDPDCSSQQDGGGIGGGSAADSGLPSAAVGCEDFSAMLEKNASAYQQGKLVACVNVQYTDAEPTKSPPVPSAGTAFPSGTYLLRLAVKHPSSAASFMNAGDKLGNAPQGLTVPAGESARTWSVCEGDKLESTQFYTSFGAPEASAYPVEGVLAIYHWNDKTDALSPFNPGVKACPVDAGVGGSGGGGAGGSGGSGGTDKPCPTEYRCGPATKKIEGYVRPYEIQKCDHTTGTYLPFVNCSIKKFGVQYCQCAEADSKPLHYVSCVQAGTDNPNLMSKVCENQHFY